MRYKGELNFFAQDFWNLMEKQGRKCALTGRELEPINTEIELIDPNKKEGKFKKDNFYLIDKNLSPIARYLSEKEILDIAVEIIECKGKEHGITLRKKQNAKG